MKLKKEFLAHVSGDEAYLIPTAGAGFAGMVKGNRTLGAVLEQLKEDTTEDRITAALLEQFDAPEDVIKADVTRVITELSKIGAIE